MAGVGREAIGFVVGVDLRDVEAHHSPPESSGYLYKAIRAGAIRDRRREPIS
jgi:hypothetical protein